MAITFLSDYGYRDEFVGICHGVIARRCPRAAIIDITHGIARHDIRAGAFVLAGALPYMPAGVHLAVVDPGVGGDRRAVALRTIEEQRILVGPDNGLLAPSCERYGGVLEAVEIAAPENVSATFHGRDVFAPAAGALAAGVALGDLGACFDPLELTGLEPRRAQLSGGALLTRVLRCDTFGNLTLEAGPGELAQLGVRKGDPVVVQCGRAHRAHRARYAATFGDLAGGELLLYEDSLGLAALAVNRGSAAALLAVEGSGGELTLRAS